MPPLMLPRSTRFSSFSHPYSVNISNGNLLAKGDTFWGTSYFKAHPLGNRCPE
ncbi:hypothetical protein E2C01_041128 [Portunus trituberculatus]|uniref:Uncharacterized protein n=1 Tax=Portunus trituberculatus TaxID=210409 RepID=A0A5B7FSP4_PORTR|nr:hypothetical protein [Portunus trituberculatus]